MVDLPATENEGVVVPIKVQAVPVHFAEGVVNLIVLSKEVQAQNIVLED